MMLGFPHGFTYPVSVISISRSFNPADRNAANSYFFSIMMLIGVIMPFISGIMVNTIGPKFSFIALIPALLRRQIVSGRRSTGTWVSA